METLTFRIVGVSPLLMHNGVLADPLNKWARAIKKISGKRKKTDEDHEEMARLEWCGSLYLCDGKPCIPSYVLEGALTGKGSPSRKVRRGPQAAAGLIVAGDFPIEYDGPQDIEELWKDENFRLRAGVRVQGARIIRTRPIFNEWAVTVEVSYNPSILNGEDVVSWMGVLGAECGLMDWRPRFGRFKVESWSRTE